MPSKPTLILVHGAWHTPDCWNKILSIIEKHGIKCIAPQMKFAGHEPPVRSNKPDVEYLQELIKKETSAGVDVVLLGHSFGGVLSSSAAQGYSKTNHSLVGQASGRVIGLIEISALLVPTGVAVNDLHGGEFPPFMQPNYETGWSNCVVDQAGLLYGDLPADEAAEWVKILKNQSLYVSTSPESIYAGHLDVPTWYLHCTNDVAIPISIQEGIVAHAKSQGADITTRSVESSHSPFLSKPQATVDFIIDALESFSN